MSVSYFIVVSSGYIRISALFARATGLINDGTFPKWVLNLIKDVRESLKWLLPMSFLCVVADCLHGQLKALWQSLTRYLVFINLDTCYLFLMNTSSC